MSNVPRSGFAVVMCHGLKLGAHENVSSSQLFDSIDGLSSHRRGHPLR